MNGAAGLAFWLAFFAICASVALFDVTARREQHDAEMDAYDRMHGGGW